MFGWMRASKLRFAETRGADQFVLDHVSSIAATVARQLPMQVVQP